MVAHTTAAIAGLNFARLSKIYVFSYTYTFKFIRNIEIIDM
jgi:hypothetical protein